MTETPPQLATRPPELLGNPQGLTRAHTRSPKNPPKQPPRAGAFHNMHQKSCKGVCVGGLLCKMKNIKIIMIQESKEPDNNRNHKSNSNSKDSDDLNHDTNNINKNKQKL